MWQCMHCRCKKPERPDTCPACGLVQAGEGTQDKYEILESYCHPLSLIMRNHGFSHYFIDACAGSGYVQAFEENKLIKGSPIIMAETREWVENTIKDKTKTPSVECIFIEINQKTRELLEKWTNRYQDFIKVIQGDCNTELEKILNKFDSDAPKPFTFIYVDPFGLGSPVIQKRTVERILERQYTELFMHFSWWGVDRSAGYFLRNHNSPDPTVRKTAKTIGETLDIFLDLKEWPEIWQKYSRNPKKRRDEILKYYLVSLEKYFKHVEYIEIPVGSEYPSYYLIFTTRNETGRKIMKHIMERKRRRGAESLEKWFGSV